MYVSVYVCVLAQGEGVGEVPDGPRVFGAATGEKGGSRTRLELRDAHVPHGPDLGPFLGNTGEMFEECLEGFGVRRRRALVDRVQ